MQQAGTLPSGMKDPVVSLESMQKQPSQPQEHRRRSGEVPREQGKLHALTQEAKRLYPKTSSTNLAQLDGASADGAGKHSPTPSAGQQAIQPRKSIAEAAAGLWRSMRKVSSYAELPSAGSSAGPVHHLGAGTAAIAAAPAGPSAPAHRQSSGQHGQHHHHEGGSIASQSQPALTNLPSNRTSHQNLASPTPGSLASYRNSSGLRLSLSRQNSDLSETSVPAGPLAAASKAAAAMTYPTNADAYQLLDVVGRGASSTVQRAIISLPNGKKEEVAVKRCDLEKLGASLSAVIAEAHLQRRLGHCPTVLPLNCAFVHGNELWMVMPLMSGGSVAALMKKVAPEGLEEELIATIAKKVLKALDYIHSQGALHRDVKAGNILVASDGLVKLGDFGVAATLERGGSWGGGSLVGRASLVGTPCWMAPEVLMGEGSDEGYGPAADIWSFGISLLEMAHGHAPFASLNPFKILMATLNGPPPQLEERCGQRVFSKQMRQVVAACLQKDPALRPTAAQLLQHKWITKMAKDRAYVVKHLLNPAHHSAASSPATTPHAPHNAGGGGAGGAPHHYQPPAERPLGASALPRWGPGALPAHGPAPGPGPSRMSLPPKGPTTPFKDSSAPSTPGAASPTPASSNTNTPRTSSSQAPATLVTNQAMSSAAAGGASQRQQQPSGHAAIGRPLDRMEKASLTNYMAAVVAVAQLPPGPAADATSAAAQLLLPGAIPEGSQLPEGSGEGANSGSVPARASPSGDWDFSLHCSSLEQSASQQPPTGVLPTAVVPECDTSGTWRYLAQLYAAAGAVAGVGSQSTSRDVSAGQSAAVSTAGGSRALDQEDSHKFEEVFKTGHQGRASPAVLIDQTSLVEHGEVGRPARAYSKSEGGALTPAGKGSSPVQQGSSTPAGKDAAGTTAVPRKDREATQPHTPTSSAAAGATSPLPPVTPQQGPGLQTHGSVHQTPGPFSPRGPGRDGAAHSKERGAESKGGVAEDAGGKGPSTTSASQASADERQTPGRGRRVGRFLVVDEVGQGGSGKK